MVAYSFKKQFAEPILEGSKTQTIRAIRTGKGRHVQPGQAIQLYTGMRTKYCRKVGDAICESVQVIMIHFNPLGSIEGVEVYGSLPHVGKMLDDFARRDGFKDAADMSEFWRKEHGVRLTFSGIMIRWKNFVPA